jgi:ribosomal protein L24
LSSLPGLQVKPQQDQSKQKSSKKTAFKHGSNVIIRKGPYKGYKGNVIIFSPGKCEVALNITNYVARDKIDGQGKNQEIPLMVDVRIDGNVRSFEPQKLLRIQIIEDETTYKFSWVSKWPESWAYGEGNVCEFAVLDIEPRLKTNINDKDDKIRKNMLNDISQKIRSNTIDDILMKNTQNKKSVPSQMCKTNVVEDVFFVIEPSTSNNGKYGNYVGHSFIA